jgi:uncharacterized protein YcnI
MKKFLTLIIFSLVAFTPIQSFAHVTVTPSAVKPAAFQTFSVNVPNEKDIPTVKVRLVLPGGLQYVQPTTKLGWNVNIIKDGENVKELEWTTGLIAKGFRDEFGFSAKVPGNETKLAWKAYQTYQDGSEVAWDKDIESNDGHSKTDSKEQPNPYSVTEVTEKDTDSSHSSTSTSGLQSSILWALTLIALILAGAAYAKSTPRNLSK